MNKAGTQRIETDRLILRRFRLEDAEDMYANWASDPEVARFLTWPTHSSVEVTKSLLANWIPGYEDGGYFNWVMEYKETGKAIGNISVVKLNENTKAADMGYCMSRAYWGQGLMPEALNAVMDYLFDVVGLCLFRVICLGCLFCFCILIFCSCLLTASGYGKCHYQKHADHYRSFLHKSSIFIPLTGIIPFVYIIFFFK